MSFVEWTLLIGAGLIMEIGGFFAGWGLLADRLAGGRKSRRCPKCWYSLEATTGGTCSECGYAARSERKLHRSRRRWKVVLLGGVFLLVGMGLYGYNVTRVLDLNRVLPISAQLLMADLLGRERVLASVGELTRDDGLSAGEMYLLESVALETLRHPSSSVDARVEACSALSMTESKIVRREEAGRAMMETLGKLPDKAGSWYFESIGKLIGSDKMVEMAVALVASSPQGMERFAAEVALSAKSPMSESAMRSYADLWILYSGSDEYSLNISEELFSQPTDAIFERLLEHLKSGKPEVRVRVFDFLGALPSTTGRYIPAHRALMKTAMAEVANPESLVRNEAMRAVGSWRSWNTRLVLDELAMLIGLPGDNHDVGPNARECFDRFPQNAEDEPKLVGALAKALISGDDSTRLAALEILSKRAHLGSAEVADAAFTAASLTEEPAVLDRLVFSMAGSIYVRTCISSAEASDPPLEWIDVEGRLVETLARPGAMTAIACKWLARSPTPTSRTIAALQALSIDTSRGRADRAAARDALLHIRDRRQAGVDVLEALK